MLSLVTSTRLAPGGQRVRFLKYGVALIILGGYCSCVTLCSWCVRSLGTSHHNNHISISPPPVRKDGMPSCQVWLIVGKRKRRVAQSVIYIRVVLITSFLVVAWVLGCPASPLMASPSHFLPPLQDHVSSHHRIGRLSARPASFSGERTCQTLMMPLTKDVSRQKNGRVGTVGIQGSGAKIGSKNSIGCGVRVRNGVKVESGVRVADEVRARSGTRAVGVMREEHAASMRCENPASGHQSVKRRGLASPPVAPHNRISGVLSSRCPQVNGRSSSNWRRRWWNTPRVTSEGMPWPSAAPLPRITRLSNACRRLVIRPRSS